jgi:hypothetical protein
MVRGGGEFCGRRRHRARRFSLARGQTLNGNQAIFMAQIKLFMGQIKRSLWDWTLESEFDTNFRTGGKVLLQKESAGFCTYQARFWGLI